MSKSRLSIAFFAFIAAILCAFACMVFSRFFIPKDAGLTAGAIVLGYGVLGFMAGLIIALIGQRWLNGRQIRTANIALGIVAAALISWLIYRATSAMRQAKVETERQRDLPVTGEAETIAPENDQNQ